jgi:Transglutaminase-like enzymes, putative cysteine proteases
MTPDARPSPWACCYRFATAVLILLSAAPLCFAKQDSVPDWVRDAAAQKLPDYPAETDAVVLLDDTTYSVAANGQATEHYRRVVKILRPQGRDDGFVAVPFDKDTKILSLHVWSIGPDGHQYAMKDNEFVQFGYPGQGDFFEDDKIEGANPPGRDPGGVVAYEYEQRIRPLLTEKTWFFQSDLPHLSQTFTLELPPGYTFGTVWAHHDPIKGADLESRRWRWEMKDVPAIDLNHVLYRPAEESLAGRMTVHYAGAGISVATDGTWQSIGEWYQGLAKDRLVATPEIAAKASELTAGKTDFYDKAEAIGDFVQDQIRYFVIEMGIGGYQPHFAGEIFHNRYGDCKDKATLLSAMLSSVGIHSALMMVDTSRGVVDPDAPSIVGDHMIAAIEIPQGYRSSKLHSVVTAKNGRRYLIFDPTWDKTPFGQLEHGLQGGYGLLLEGDQSQIVALPVLPPELNTIHRTGHFQLQPDGSLKGTVTETRFGDISESRRRIYVMGDAKQQSDFLDNTLSNDFTTFTVSGFKVQNAATLGKNLTTSYSLSADHFAKAMGPLLMVRPRVLGSDGLETDHKARHVPINLSQTMQATDDFSIDLPPGYTVDETPDPVKLDLGFAAYESAIQVKGDTLHYTSTYTVRKVTVPADQYSDLHKLAGVVEAEEQGRAVLKKR